MNTNGYRQCFLLVFHLVCFTIVVLSIWWIFGFQGGLTEYDGTLNYLINWHQLLNLIAIVWFFSNAVIVYRVYSCPLEAQNMIHIGLQTAALILLLVGVLVMEIWKFHDSSLVPAEQYTLFSSKHFYSFHSWCGVITIVAFLIQYAVLVVPGWREKYRDMSIWMTVFTVVAAVQTAINGIEDLVWWRYADGLLSYSSFDTEGVLVNMLVSLIFLLLLLITWAWFRAPYSAEDRVQYQDMGVVDNTHTSRPMKGEFI